MKYFRTNIIDVDKQIEAFIEFSKSFFKFKIVSIYLLGSYIDNSFIRGSDLDIAIIYKNTKQKDIEKIEGFFSRFSRDIFKREIDLYLISIDQIKKLDQKMLVTREGIVNIKIASRLI